MSTREMEEGIVMPGISTEFAQISKVVEYQGLVIRIWLPWRMEGMEGGLEGHVHQLRGATGELQALALLLAVLSRGRLSAAQHRLCVAAAPRTPVALGRASCVLPCTSTPPQPACQSAGAPTRPTTGQLIHRAPATDHDNNPIPIRDTHPRPPLATKFETQRIDSVLPVAESRPRLSRPGA